jgi:hypothetical protein
VARLRETEAAPVDDDQPPVEWLDHMIEHIQRAPAYDPKLDPAGHGPPRISEADARARALRFWESKRARRRSLDRELGQ